MIRYIAKSDKLFFSLLFLGILILFKNAFTIGFFQDDYFFIHISQIHSISDFFNFFSPIRTYSYKPLASEVFYSILRLFSYNLVIGHTIVFLCYFIGLYALYKVLIQVFHDNLFAKIAVLIYGIHFTHVFNLYWFATFQEIVVFTTLTLSFYFYLNNRLKISLFFFILALLSKETAILYSLFLILYEVITQKGLVKKKSWKRILVYLITAAIFALIYKYSLTHVTSLDNYKIDVTNIKLLINNALWYTLWSIGFPNFMPDVMSSILAPPLPVFNKYLENTNVRLYFGVLIAFFSFLILSLIQLLLLQRKRFIKSIIVIAIFIINFYLFLGPILFFSHKWMVRLMLPQLFISLILTWIIINLYKGSKINRIFSYSLLSIYLVLMIVGVNVHESSSTYLLENRIYKNALQYFNDHEDAIIQSDGIFFVDKKTKDGKEILWGQSKKLKSSLWDQYFITYYFPDQPLQVYYDFESEKPEGNIYSVQSPILLK